MKGTGLIAAILIILIASVMGVTIASLIATEAGSSLNYLQSQKAFFIAESGIHYVVGKLRLDTDYRDTPTKVEEYFGDGRFSVEVADSYTLTSTGTVGNTTREVTQSFNITSDILEKAIHADGSLVDFDGSTGTVNGDVSCHVSVVNYDDITINGTITEDLARLNPVLDFDYYASIADTYSTSDLTFSNDTYTGVYYTTRKVTIEDNVIINGSVIANGSISFKKKVANVQISPSNNYPALASNSSITCTDTGPAGARRCLQNSTINGLIFSTGGITFNYARDSEINGTILSDGNINIQDGLNWTIAYDEAIFSPMTPGLEAGEMIAQAQADWDELY